MVSFFRSWSWPSVVLEQVTQDLRYGARGLWRARGFTAGAVAVLALGVGANLALFQVFDAAIVHRYSFPVAEAFVRISRTSRDGTKRTFPSVAVDFYRSTSSSFASLISEDASLSLSIDGNPRRSTFVSDNYFSNVTILPAIGRVFDSQDVQLDAPAVVLLGHQYWRTQFAADPQVPGRTIHVNGVAVEIVGVLPENFYGFSLQQTDLWFPLNHRRLLIPGSPAGQSEFFGRLKPGVEAVASAAELTALTRELAHREPRYFGEDDRIQLEPVQESLVQFFLTRSALIVIFVGMVFLVLLSACAHLGNMLLVRGLARQHELAIRASIGASRGRLIRQLLTENALLAVLGSAAGLAVGVITARLFVISAPVAFQVSIHWQTLVACVVMTFISVLAFALPSARETTRPGFQTSSLRSRFVANQVSVSCVLLIVTGVFAARHILAPSLDLKFDYRNLVVVDPHMDLSEGPLDGLQRRLDALSARYSELPGVDSITVATAVPLSGRVVDNFPFYPRIVRTAVAPSFFDVMHLSVMRGRTFLPGESNAVIASESAARSLWPNQDPLGQMWSVAGAKRRVVGVVENSGADDDPANTVEAYLPISASDVDRCVLILHTRGDPSRVVGMIPRVTSEFAGNVTVTPLGAMLESRQRIDARVAIFGSIGFIATVLAAAGIFALMSFSVVQRTREIGIRIAIGATRQDLVWGLLSLHTKPLAGGVGTGAVVAVMLLLFIRAVVYPERAVVFFGGLVLGLLSILAVGALATVIPALRALRIDPSKALRAD